MVARPSLSADTPARPATSPIGDGYAPREGRCGAIVIGGHTQGLGIMRSLGRKGIAVYLIDETGFCISRYSRYCSRFIRFPRLYEGDAIVELLTSLAASEEGSSWVVFPSHDAIVEALSRNATRLGPSLRVAVPDETAVQVALNKKLTYRLASTLEIPIPRSLYPANERELSEVAKSLHPPFIIKPAVMHDFYRRLRTKALVVSDPDQLEERYRKALTGISASEVILQEIIPGSPENLYSCCCLCDSGEVIASMVARRSRQIPMDFGKATTYAETVSLPRIERDAHALLRAMNYSGVAEVEFKYNPDDDSFRLLEVNARTWKWHSLAQRAGIDIPYLLYLQVLGKPIDTQPSPRIGVKWIDFLPDFYVAMGEIVRGRLRIADYLKSLRGDVEHAVASAEDPLPSVAYLSFLPYFLFHR